MRCLVYVTLVTSAACGNLELLDNTSVVHSIRGTGIRRTIQLASRQHLQLMNHTAVTLNSPSFLDFQLDIYIRHSYPIPALRQTLKTFPFSVSPSVVTNPRAADSRRASVYIPSVSPSYSTSPTNPRILATSPVGPVTTR